MDSISHVINFDMPDTADAYIHRIGCTGRAERNGDAFTLVTPDDNDMIRELEKIMEHKLERQMMQGFNYSAPAPSQAVLAPRKPKQSTTVLPQVVGHHLGKQHT